MFEASSRYAVIEDAIYETPDGQRQIAYKRRRFLPQGGAIPLQVEVTVTAGDRLDLVAARTLGDALQFWQICDANNCMNPFDLMDAGQEGRTLRVPVPQFQAAR